MARPAQQPLLKPRPDLIFIGSEKGGVGKSFVTSLCVDLLDVVGVAARIVQIDDQERLPTLYPGRVTTVPTPKLADLRRDPGVIVSTFDPLFSAIEQTVSDKVPTVIDIGGPQQSLVEQYCSLVDLDEELTHAGLNTIWLVPTTAEPESMRGAVRTATAVKRVLPAVTNRLILNLRDGLFNFYPGAPADRLWREQLLPLGKATGAIELPAIAPGSWQPCEAAGQRFLDIIAADIADIQALTGRSRPMAKVLRGDIAAFMAAANHSLGPAIGVDIGGADDH